MDQDIKYLKETLKLAEKGLGWTNPNPMVGSIIVKNGQIIGQGYHHKVGQNHAEIEALNSAGENPSGATMYVSLEPCASSGRTPPCVDAIIKAGIKKVIFSSLDPNPKNHGKGIAKLREAGIETSAGILEQEVRKLNEAFFTFHEKKRPFVVLKFATSLDGKMAARTGDSKWITNAKARLYAQGLRAEYQGLIIGINTVLIDNPNLGARLKDKKDPIRIIIDPKLQIPLNADALRDTNVIVATTTSADKRKKGQLERSGFTVLTFEGEHVSIPKLLSALKEKEIISILVEGGGETLGNFIDSKIIDKLYAFQAPVIIGGREAVSIGGKGAANVKEALHFKNTILKKFDDNILTIGYPQK